MRMPIAIVGVVVQVAVLALRANADDVTIKAVPSRPSVQKGSVFDIRLEVSTRNAVDDITVAPLVPSGFRLDSVPSPGVEVDNSRGVVHIAHLAADSSLIVWFRAWPPTFWGGPHRVTASDPQGASADDTSPLVGIPTTEPKTFAFNVFYTTRDNGATVPHSQAITATVAYTTHLYLYLLAGLLGTILGHLIKTGIKRRDQLSETLQRDGLPTKLSGWLKELLGTNVTGLLTILVIGFGTLLVLARDGIPVSAWYQAVALGIGLAVLTDDQLLAKFGPQ